MLVLTRRRGEVLLIGDDIRITVLEIRGTQIKLGIDAPKSITVLREELKRDKDSTSPEEKTQDPTRS